MGVLLKIALKLIYVDFLVYVVASESQLILNADVFVEGAILKASCPAADGQPVGAVRWFLDDLPVNGGDCDDFQTTVSRSTHYEICVKVTRIHHNKLLKCVLMFDDKTVVISRSLFVKYVDLSLDRQTYNVGEKLSAKCVVRNSLNAKVSWFVNDKFIKNATEPTMKFDETNNEITVRFLGLLSEEDNGMELICEAEIDGIQPVAKSMQVLNVTGVENKEECPDFCWGEDEKVRSCDAQDIDNHKGSDKKTTVDAGGPLVSSDESQLQLKTDVFVEGAILKVPCPAVNDKTIGAVKWFIDDVPIEDGGCSDDETFPLDQPLKPQFCLKLTRYHHGKVLKCATKSEPEETFNVTKAMCVKYVDLSLDRQTYNVGDKMSAKCVVRNSLNAKVSWFVGDEFIKTATDPTIKFDETNNEITAWFLGLLSEEDSGKALICHAEIDGKQGVAKSMQILNVKGSPTSENKKEDLDLMAEEDEKVRSCDAQDIDTRNETDDKSIVDTLDVKLSLDRQTYNAGDKVSAKCVVKNSLNAKVSWFVDEEFIKSATHPTMKFDETNCEITVRFLGELSEGDNGKTLICQAEIDGIQAVAKSMQILNVKGPSTSVSDKGQDSDLMTEEDEKVQSCDAQDIDNRKGSDEKTSVDAGGPLVSSESHLQQNTDVYVEGAILKVSCPAVNDRPSGAVKWFIDDVPIEDGGCNDDETLPSDQPKKPQFCLKLTRYHHGKVLRCATKSGPQQTFNVTKRMCVKYVELFLDSHTYNVGDKVSAKCVIRNSLNAKVSWFVDKEFLKNATDPTMRLDENNNEVTVWFIGLLSEGDNGKALVCEANIDGLQPVAKAMQKLNVKDSPISLTLSVDKEDGYKEGDVMRASFRLSNNFTFTAANFTCLLGEELLVPQEGELMALLDPMGTHFKNTLTKRDDGKVLRCDVEYNNQHMIVERTVSVKASFTDAELDTSLFSVLRNFAWIAFIGILKLFGSKEPTYLYAEQQLRLRDDCDDGIGRTGVSQATTFNAEYAFEAMSKHSKTITPKKRKLDATQHQKMALGEKILAEKKGKAEYTRKSRPTNHLYEEQKLHSISLTKTVADLQTQLLAASNDLKLKEVDAEAALKLVGKHIHIRAKINDLTKPAPKMPRPRVVKKKKSSKSSPPEGSLQPSASEPTAVDDGMTVKHIRAKINDLTKLAPKMPRPRVVKKKKSSKSSPPEGSLQPSASEPTAVGMSWDD